MVEVGTFLCEVQEDTWVATAVDEEQIEHHDLGRKQLINPKWTSPHGHLSCVCRSHPCSRCCGLFRFRLFSPRNFSVSRVAPALFVLCPHQAWRWPLAVSGFRSLPQANRWALGSLTLLSSCLQKSGWFIAQIWHWGDGLLAFLIYYLAATIYSA